MAVLCNQREAKRLPYGREGVPPSILQHDLGAGQGVLLVGGADLHGKACPLRLGAAQLDDREQGAEEDAPMAADGLQKKLFDCLNHVIAIPFC